MIFLTTSRPELQPSENANQYELDNASSSNNFDDFVTPLTEDEIGKLAENISDKLVTITKQQLQSK